MLVMNLVGMAVVLAGTSAAPEPKTASYVSGQGEQPFVELWTSGDLFRRGDRAHVWFRTDIDAYVTVLRIDTDGRVRVLYPEQPWQDNFVPGGYRIEVSPHAGGYGAYAFVVDDYPGQGYLFAIASLEPFEYRRLIRGDVWDYRAIGLRGQVTGDPYVAVMDIIDEIALDPYATSYDVYPYHVERRFEYPRFLCYDCHEHVSYDRWDPYRYSCVRFRIVVHDDPYYYPTRVYRGTRVVYTRPHRIEPRYVFKDRDPGTPYLTRARRPGERDVRNRTVTDPNDRGRVVSPRPETRERAPRAIDELRRQLKSVPRSSGIDVRRRASPSDTARTLRKPRLERRTPARASTGDPRRAAPKDPPTRKPVIKPAPKSQSTPPIRKRPDNSKSKPQVKRRPRPRPEPAG